MKKKIIFITGLHRAGTHAVAEQTAKSCGVVYLEERGIKWDDFNKASKLIKKHPEGFVLHCPGLAHKTIELAKIGEVCWVTRKHDHVVTSMVNGNINNMAWHLMKGFRQEFPKDPIWGKLEYEGREDNHVGFPVYHTLLVKVKEYFYKNKFKNVCKEIQLEKQPYYNYDKCLTAIKPLKARAARLAKKAEKLYAF